MNKKSGCGRRYPPHGWRCFGPDYLCPDCGDPDVAIDPDRPAVKVDRAVPRSERTILIVKGARFGKSATGQAAIREALEQGAQVFVAAPDSEVVPPPPTLNKIREHYGRGRVPDPLPVPPTPAEILDQELEIRRRMREEGIDPDRPAVPLAEREMQALREDQKRRGLAPLPVGAQELEARAQFRFDGSRWRDAGNRALDLVDRAATGTWIAAGRTWRAAREFERKLRKLLP